LAIEEFELDLMQVQEGFKIDNLETAIWAMSVIRSATDQQREVKNATKSYMDRITSWRDTEMQKLQARIDWMTPYLEQYHRTIFEADPKRKTINLPDGNLCLRKANPTFDRDDKALVAWLKEHELASLIDTTEVPQWGELKKKVKVMDAVITLNGETVDGVTVTQPDDAVKFGIKISEES
jgi:hypothetical protein